MHYTKKVERLLLKVKKHILEEPKRYSQATWGSADPEYIMDRFPTHTRKSDVPPCGTVCCFAGWTAVLGKPSLFGKKQIDANRRQVPTTARELLGMNLEESEVMFCATASRWPNKYYKAYSEAKTHAGRARAAARFIDAIIKTKGEILTQHAS